MTPPPGSLAGVLSAGLTAGAGVYLRIPEMLFQTISAICLILGNAAGTSWELLVKVAQHERAAARG